MKIVLKNIQPLYLNEAAVKNSQIWDCEYEWPKGSSIKINAPSGKGKTTFIHILYGLLKAYTGQVILDNLELKSITPNQMADLRNQSLSLVFQNHRLFPNLTGMENINVNTDLTRRLSDDRIALYAEKLKVKEVLNQRCALLSQGEMQRVAILRALAQPFDWLLLDEPFSHLDPKAAQAAASLIMEACQDQGSGFVLTCLGDKPYLEAGSEYYL